MVYVSFARRPESPSSMTKDGATEEWICEGIDDAVAVQGAAMLYTPPALATRFGIFQRDDIQVTRAGFRLHYVTVPYAKRSNVGKWTWNADTQGGQFTIKTSREHLASYVAPGQVAKDHKGAIGRQPDGTIEGVPIIIPAMKFNVTYSHPLGVVTPAFARYIHSLTGMVNSAPFLGWAPGEVLFLGGQMSDGTDAEATATYSFAMERNLQNALIGGITVTQKQGHDFAWVEFRPALIDGQTVTIPRQIDVCRVYERTNLAQALGL